MSLLCKPRIIQVYGTAFGDQYKKWQAQSIGSRKLDFPNPKYEERKQ